MLNCKKGLQSTDADSWEKKIANEKAQFDKYIPLTPVPRVLYQKGPMCSLLLSDEKNEWDFLMEF